MPAERDGRPGCGDCSGAGWAFRDEREADGSWERNWERCACTEPMTDAEIEKMHADYLARLAS